MPFSNHSAHQISIWGKRFATAEHAFQYRKFQDSDPRWASKIRQAKSPVEAKRLGWERIIDRQEWDAMRRDVMTEIVRAKTAQHADVYNALLATGDKAIVLKDTGKDKYWGAGRDDKGHNNLGKIWMFIRTELAETGS